MRFAAGLLALGTLAAGSARAATFTLMRDAPAEVRFTVDAPLDQIVGTSHRISGELNFDPNMLSLSGGQVKVDAGSFHTGIALRDEDLRDQFLEVQKFPEILLTLQKLSRTTSPGLAAGARVEAEVSGTLALHGVPHAVTFPISIERSADGSLITVHGAFEVPFQDYGIQRPQKLFLKLGELAKIDVRATFTSVPTTDPSIATAVAAREAAPQP